MPVEIHWEPRGVLRRCHGHVTMAERRRSLELICGDARFDRLRYTITDYLDVTRYDTDEQDTEEVAALHIAPLALNPDIRIAAVVTDPLILAAIRHFIALKFTRQPYRCFATMAEARAWIAGSGG